jgi:hypothetical protein
MLKSFGEGMCLTANHGESLLKGSESLPACLAPLLCSYPPIFSSPGYHEYIILFQHWYSNGVYCRHSL